MPSRRRIPRIFDRGIVIAVYAIDDIDATDIGFVGVANIGIVEGEGFIGPIIGRLNERAKPAVNLTCHEEARVLNHGVVVGAEAIGLAIPISRFICQILLDVREGGNHHPRYWDLNLSLPLSSSFRFTIPTACAARRVAIELELAPICRQLREGSVMTGGARLSGLACEAWNGRRRPWSPRDARDENQRECGSTAKDINRRQVGASGATLSCRH